MTKQILPCQYCGKPLEMAVTGTPKVSHWECTLKAFEPQRERLRNLYKKPTPKEG